MWQMFHLVAFHLSMCCCFSAMLMCSCLLPQVYQPCLLQAKKRYVGFMYQSPQQAKPAFDAKGIETVRRDNCGVVSKVMERCIKILFTSRDLSSVRRYLQCQLHKMMAERVGLHDYIFAKEYRGMTGYRPGACVPSLEISRLVCHTCLNVSSIAIIEWLWRLPDR